jgi:hypothetical protein
MTDTTSSPTPSSPTPPTSDGATIGDERGFDLRALFHAVGSTSITPALGAALPDRTTTSAEVELFDEASVPVSAEPLVAGGFVDGIQAAVRLTHRNHRPVYLMYVAAGAVAGWGRPVGVEERLMVVCAATDRYWVDTINVGLPVMELDAASPPEIERAAARLLATTRDALERRLVDQLVADGVTPLVLDGSLIGRPPVAGLVGVVKSTHTRYLSDEAALWDLPQGWRSARFAVRERGDERFSCYVRLTGGGDQPWDFGLIRVESRDAEILDAVCALALAERQGPASRDARHDRHLATVRACEDYLRARRPPVFGISL